MITNNYQCMEIKLTEACVDIPRGLTRLFRAVWIIELCRQLRKSQLIINKLKWSKCSGMNCLLFRNEVINGPGMSNHKSSFWSMSAK